MNFYISPLEQFAVMPLISMKIFYTNYYMTNLLFYSIIVLLLVTLLHSNLKTLITSDNWSLPVETSLESVNKTMKEQSNTEYYMPFIYSIFIFILFSNLFGNVTYSFTITSSAIVCIGLSLSIFIGVTLLSINLYKLHFFSFFVPAGTPLILVPLLVLIELISYMSRSVSLGLRLFANIVAGHTLLKILSTFLLSIFKKISILTLIPFSLFLSLIGLELAVSFIQAYVFTILMCSYLRDARELH